MKNKLIIILSIIMTFTFLHGCNVITDSSISSSFSDLESESSSNAINQSSEPNNSSEYSESSSSLDSSSIEQSEQSSSTIEESSSFESIEIVGQEKSIYFDGNTYVSGISKYSTGCYCQFSQESYDFEIYRGYRSSSSLFASFMVKEKQIDINSLSGAFYNVSPINYISSIEIEYKCASNFNLYTGNSKDKLESIEIPSSTSYVSKLIEINYATYFSVETTLSNIDIKNVTINYIDNGDISYASYLRSGENECRINPVVYEGTLVSKESYVDIPVDVTFTENSYVVNKTKRYTYYSYDDVASNPSLATLASYTDPMDVANYFIAFKTYPANYVYKKNYNTAYNIFKKDTRCVSDYSRTNGYATAVPCTMKNGAPHYYECDIALSDSYSSGNRGVGRLVVWEYGFNSTGYDSSIVAVYTDDHYATFAEYLNTGVFGKKFNAEQNRTAFVHGGAKTYN